MTFAFSFTQAATIAPTTTQPTAIDLDPSSQWPITVADDDGTIVVTIPEPVTPPDTYYLRTEAGTKIATESFDILLIEHA